MFMEYFHTFEPGGGPAVSISPALFVSHGAPTAALARDSYRDALAAFAKKVPPSAIMVLSAHWLTEGAVEVTAIAGNNGTIHDFSGFPDELYRMAYPAPGSEPLARIAAVLLAEKKIPAALNHARGLDHGAWVPLTIMYPESNVPVAQISIPWPSTPEMLFAMGEALRPLRARGVLLVGSGGMTHNLSLMAGVEKDAAPLKEAAAFDAWVAAKVHNRDAAELFEYLPLAPHAAAMHPTAEHLLPLFFTLGCARDDDRLETVFEGFHHAAFSMRSFAFTAARDNKGGADD